MGKYAPLGVFLRRWKRRNGNAHSVELTFIEVERIIAAPLPRGATTRDWWHNASRTERGFVQSRAWLSAGFEAQLLANTERVRFLRTDLHVLQRGERVRR